MPPILIQYHRLILVFSLFLFLTPFIIIEKHCPSYAQFIYLLDQTPPLPSYPSLIRMLEFLLGKCSCLHPTHLPAQVFALFSPSVGFWTELFLEEGRETLRVILACLRHGDPTFYSCSLEAPASFENSSTVEIPVWKFCIFPTGAPLLQNILALTLLFLHSQCLNSLIHQLI